MKQPTLASPDPHSLNDRIDPPWTEAERASEARHGAGLYRRGGLTDESAAYWARKLAAGDPRVDRQPDGTPTPPLMALVTASCPDCGQPHSEHHLDAD